MIRQKIKFSVYIEVPSKKEAKDTRVLLKDIGNQYKEYFEKKNKKTVVNVFYEEYIA